MAWSGCAAASRSSSPPPHGDRFMSARLRITFALLWLGVLLLAGLWISAHLQLTGDLRKFMPAPNTTGHTHLIDATRAACENGEPVGPCTGAGGAFTIKTLPPSHFPALALPRF